jgi:predicted nucleic-acid-binding Zn-ribbon protein
MKKGICIKCGLSAVHVKVMGFQEESFFLPNGGWLDGVIRVTSRDYVCANCGYHEQYIVEPEALAKIAELSAKGGYGWDKVPTN